MRSWYLASVALLAGVVAAPAEEGERIAEGIVELRSGGLRALIADNEAHGAVHRAGYSGVAEIEPAGLGRNVFVPAVAGLNFEHILSGDEASYGRDIFEPRHAPMAVWRFSGSSAEIRQERTESWPLRTRLTYALAGDDAIDLTVTATPLESDDWKKHGWLGLFFASYIDEPEDRAIHFIGRSRPGKGDATPRWIRHLSPRHGEAACHRPAGSAWDPPMDPGLPIPLAAGQSDLEYVYPFYYGVTRGKALIFLFEKPSEKTETRLAQSPTGGGLALRIHARRNGGALPASLEDLVAAKILPTVPRDPFTDEPLRYSRERAIVWSAGPDGKYDGGREADPEDDEAPSDLVWKLAAH